MKLSNKLYLPVQRAIVGFVAWLATVIVGLEIELDFVVAAACDAFAVESKSYQNHVSYFNFVK